MENQKIAKIQIDHTACIGCGTCTIVSPGAFELDEQSRSSVKDGALQEGDEKLLLAAQSCPVGAIMLFNNEGKQIYPEAS